MTKQANKRYKTLVSHKANNLKATEDDVVK